MLRPGRITLVGAASANGTSTAPSVARMAGTQAGDRLYVFLHSNNAPSVTDNNAGFATTLYGSFVPASYTAQWHIFTREMTGAEGANIAYTLGTSQRWTLVIFALRGMHPTQLFEVPPVNGNVNLGGPNYTTITAPGVQAWSDGSWAFAVAGLDSALDNWTGLPGAPWTTLINAGGTANTIAISYQEMVVSGTTDATFTKNNDPENSTTFQVFTVAAAPVPAHPFFWRQVAAAG